MEKKLIKKGFSIFLLTILASSTAFSQESNKAFGGSPYSAYGIGIPQDLTAHNFKGQGLWGISGISDEVTTLANPAVWSTAYLTQASTGLQLSKYNIKNTAVSEKKSNLSAGYLHLLFPVSPGKLGLSVSLYPVSRSNFEVLGTGTFISSTADTISYNNEIQSSGGINKFEVGLGVKITDNISFGYAPSVAFMTLEDSESFIFSSSTFTGQNQSSSVTGTTFSQRFGVTAGFDNIFSEQDKVSIGATFNLPYTIKGKRDLNAEKTINGVDQTVDLTYTLNNREGNVYIPLEASLGLGYAPSVLVNFAVEGVFQKWSEFSNDIKPSDEAVMSDRLKIGFGGQYHPYKKNSRAFFSKFKYSGGVSYDTGHLTIQGNDISTLWINTGLGILGRSSRTSFPSLDISFQYGFRGTTDNNLIQEQIWSLGFSLNLTERMFVRPKLR